MSQMNTTPALELEGVTMRIAGLTAVDNASFSVPAGKIVSLIGPNGAGKTTTYNVISGYMKPTSGPVSYTHLTLPTTPYV